jgi:hypothetical protein
MKSGALPLKVCIWYWQMVLAKAFGAENVSVRAYGNSLTAAGAIRGLAAHEFTKAELNFHTLESPVGVFARARKRG